jgi:hypothetical protein
MPEAGYTWFTLYFRPKCQRVSLILLRFRTMGRERVLERDLRSPAGCIFVYALHGGTVLVELYEVP